MALFPGDIHTIFESGAVLGGHLDGSGDASRGYSLRGGCMFSMDNYECIWGLFKSIPSLYNQGKTVFEETVEFNEKHKSVFGSSGANGGLSVTEHLA